MAKPKRTDKQRQSDLPRISELYLKGFTQEKIAAEFNITRQQIAYDLKDIKDQWKDSTLIDFNEAQNRELDRIDLLESEAWKGWNRSIGTVVKTTEKSGDSSMKGSYAETSTVAEEQAGDSRFLEIINKCIQRRCDILGLKAPIKTELMGGLDITRTDLGLPANGTNVTD